MVDTIAVPHCHEIPGGACPPLHEWPMKHLVLGTCPRCGREDRKAWRAIVARRAAANSTGER